MRYTIKTAILLSLRLEHSEQKAVTTLRTELTTVSIFVPSTSTLKLQKAATALFIHIAVIDTLQQYTTTLP